MKNKLKLKIIILINSFLLLYLSYLYYENFYLIKESCIPKELIRLESNKIDFDKLISGKWDNLIVVSPYTLKDVEKNLKINLNRLANKSIDYGEGQSLFIFCKKNKIESYFYIPYDIAEVDFSNLHNKKINRSDSLFLINKKGINPKLYKINED